ncbi:hypothetical protein Scep_016877 [Stephania cephalantha]|uniref:Uncharacterized protein n=1 Tax=Stephania cephalantha TaxID=152367 RepID=A0AAP0INF2_9MAGN
MASGAVEELAMSRSRTLRVEEIRPLEMSMYLKERGTFVTFQAESLGLISDIKKEVESINWCFHYCLLGPKSETPRVGAPPHDDVITVLAAMCDKMEQMNNFEQQLPQ